MMESNIGSRRVLSAEEVRAAVEKIADAVCEEFFRNGKVTPVAFLGIQIGGIPLSRRIAKRIRERCGYDAPVGTLDISMYRDDIGLRSGLPLIRETVIPFNMEDAKVILVDDVLSSGRAIRAALSAVTSFGRPACLRLAVLIDRGRPEFPIRADYVGFNAFDVDPAQKIVLKLTENDGEDAAVAIQWR